MEEIKYTILIVDDTPKNLQVLGNILKQENYKVEFAINGKSALDWLKREKFDLILLDVMMPEMDGYEVCEKIRSGKNEIRNIPIIFLTAKTDSESVIKGFDLGAQDYITKPFNNLELLVRVKTQIELKTNRDKLKSVNKWLENEVEKRTAELKKANKELFNLDNAKSEFLNIISHEIRTPLNGILGALHLLKDQVESKEMIKLVNLLNDSVDRLEKFSFMALQITSLRTNKQKLNLQNIKIRELIEFSLIELSQTIKKQKVYIDFDKAQNEISILADYDLFIIAVSKILENAILHSPEEGKVTISTEQIDNEVVIEVRDQGKGFSEEILKNTFEAFSTGTEQINKNIGIDLTLIHLIIEAHKAKIVLINASEGGAIVKIAFPVN